MPQSGATNLINLLNPLRDSFTPLRSTNHKNRTLYKKQTEIQNVTLHFLSLFPTFLLCYLQKWLHYFH